MIVIEIDVQKEQPSILSRAVRARTIDRQYRRSAAVRTV